MDCFEFSDLISFTKINEWKAKDVNKYYKQENPVGSGTFGYVYKGSLIQNQQEKVAIKKLDLANEKEGFPITALREIKTLRKLDHINIVKLLDIMTNQVEGKQKQSTFLIFEYVDHDFLGLLKNRVQFTIQQIKSVFKQILEGVAYLHSKNIIHRDIKSANLLYSNQGYVKLADFGLAIEQRQPNSRYTSKVVTLWYRAPELLYGSENYNNKIDIWSVGCLFAEILIGRPLLPGDKEAKQIELIYEMCGTPDQYNWESCKQLKFYEELKPKYIYPPKQLYETIQKFKNGVDEKCLDLINQLLNLNPTLRPSAEEALQHQYFKEEPFPCQYHQMPKFEKELHGQLKNQNQRNWQSQKVLTMASMKNLNNNQNKFQWNQNHQQDELEEDYESPQQNLKDQINNQEEDDQFQYSFQFKKIKQEKYEQINENKKIISLFDV